MYSYFTQKQANILYRAFKQGKLNASKQFIQKMYNIVNVRYGDLSVDDKRFRNHCENAIEHLFNNRLNLAQYEIDGFSVVKRYVTVDTVEREATEDDFFYDVGEIISEDIKEARYFVVDADNDGKVVQDEKGDLVFLENGERDLNYQAS